MGSLEVGGTPCRAAVTALTSSLSLQSYLFLLSSDYERSEWREAIQKLQKKGKAPSSPMLFGGRPLCLSQLGMSSDSLQPL